MFRGYGVAVIESLHVATGAAIGEATGSRFWAAVLGPVSHFFGDLTPHEDIPSDAFETLTGIAAGLWVVHRRGLFSPAAIGALFATMPDWEHVLRPERRGRKQLFPSHRYAILHMRGGLPAWLQLAAAGVILGVTTRRLGS
jgi:hypothetical protein